MKSLSVTITWKLLSSAFLSCCLLFYYAVQGGSNFWVCGSIPEVWPFKWELLSSAFLWYCLLCCKILLLKAVLAHASADEIKKCDHSNENYRGILSFGTFLMNDDSNESYSLHFFNASTDNSGSPHTLLSSSCHVRRSSTAWGRTLSRPRLIASICKLKERPQWTWQSDKEN